MYIILEALVLEIFNFIHMYLCNMHIHSNNLDNYLCNKQYLFSFVTSMLITAEIFV